MSNVNERRTSITFPKGISISELRVARELVASFADEQAQDIVDEWHGMVRAGRARPSPIGCLRKLVALAQKGKLTYEFKYAIADARDAQQHIAAQAARPFQMPPPPPSWEDSVLKKKLNEIMRRAKARNAR